MDTPEAIPEQPAKRLRSRQAEVVAQVVAEAVAAELPLPGALLAAAEDATSPAAASALRRLAAEVRRGRSLDEIQQDRGLRLPRYLAALLQSAGDSPLTALTEWLDCQEAVRRNWRSIVAAVAYPALVLALALVVLVALDLLVVGPMLAMYADFELQLPQLTQMLVWCHERGIPIAIGGTAALLVILAAYRTLGGAARWRRLMESLPLVGMLWHWTSVMELSRLLAVLLQRQVPLPDALETAADGLHSAHLREVSLRLAAGVRAGIPLADVLDSTYRMPATLTPIVRWGERTGRLAEAFGVAGDMFEARSSQRASLLAAALPPMVFLFLAVTIPLFVLGVYMPMFSMIQGLA